MPRRSAGCEKCRQRKVRCDEAKPNCRRCAEYGVNCPGYRPDAGNDFRFLVQTAHTKRIETTPNLGLANNRESQLRWRNQFSGKINNTGPIAMNNNNLHRMHLLSTFLDLYLPKRRDAKLISHFAYITALPNIDLSTPLLQIAVDTLCLAELGSLHDDERCLHESRGRYVRALPMLAKELARPPSNQLPKDTILAAIVVLALCELFDAIAKSSNGGQGWISHVQGAQQYLRAHGPGVVDSPFGWLLFHNIRHSSLCMGLVKRRAVFLAEPKWLKMTRKLSEMDSYVALYDLSLRLPGLLERADGLGDSRDFGANFRQLCEDLIKLRSALESWLTRFRTTIPFETVDIPTFKEFTKHCSDRTYTTAFTFPSVQVCSQFQLFWITCLLCDFTFANIYRLHSKRHTLPEVSTFTTRSKPSFWRDMYVSAMNYCRTLPFCCEPETASSGRIGTFLLRITQSYFAIAGHEKELEWCRSVRRMLESSSAKPPKTAIKADDIAQDPQLAFSANNNDPKLGVIILEGEYPNRTYNPRQLTTLHPQDGANYTLPLNRRDWHPSLLEKTEYNTLNLPTIFDTSPASATPICRGSALHMSSPQLSPTQDDSDLQLPTALHRDLSSLPKNGRRWNLPSELASLAPQVLTPQLTHRVGHNPEYTAFISESGKDDFSALGDLTDFVLLPDGEARKGPVGAMCF